MRNPELNMQHYYQDGSHFSGGMDFIMLPETVPEMSQEQADVLLYERFIEGNEAFLGAQIDTILENPDEPLIGSYASVSSGGKRATAAHRFNMLSRNSRLIERLREQGKTKIGYRYISFASVAKYAEDHGRVRPVWGNYTPEEFDVISNLFTAAVSAMDNSPIDDDEVRFIDIETVGVLPLNLGNSVYTDYLSLPEVRDRHFGHVLVRDKNLIHQNLRLRTAIEQEAQKALRGEPVDYDRINRVLAASHTLPDEFPSTPEKVIEWSKSMGGKAAVERTNNVLDDVLVEATQRHPNTGKRKGIPEDVPYNLDNKEMVRNLIKTNPAFCAEIEQAYFEQNLPSKLRIPRNHLLIRMNEKIDDADIKYFIRLTREHEVDLEQMFY